MKKRYAFIEKYFKKTAGLSTKAESLRERSKVIIDYLKTSDSRNDKITEGFLKRMESYLEKLEISSNENEKGLLIGLAEDSLIAAFDSAGIKYDNYKKEDFAPEVSVSGDSGAVKNVDANTLKSMSSYKFKPLIIPGNYVLKFNLGGQEYICGADYKSYFNVTKLRPVKESEMELPVTVKDLGQTFKVPFFWAANSFRERSSHETGQRAGLNMPKTNTYDSSILNISSPYPFFKGSEYLPEDRSLRRLLLKIFNLESKVLSGEPASMLFSEEEPAVSESIYDKREPVRRSDLTLDIIYSPSGEVKYYDGKLEGLYMKSVNIIDGSVVSNYELDKDDLAHFLDSGDKRIALLNRINNSNTDMSNAR